MTNPMVSVIVNCYNSAKYLRPTIDSILNQKFLDYEVIFWDNQSTDDTADIVKSYTDSRFLYCYASNHVSLGEARNNALEKVSGKYVVFLDSDDVWLPDFLLRAVECLENGCYKFYYSNYYNWIEGKSEVVNNTESNSGTRNFRDLLSCYSVGISAAVFCQDIIQKTSLRFNSRYQLIEDYDFFLNIVRRGDAYYDSIPLMKYRMHENSLTNKSKKNWAIEFDMLYQDLINNILNAEERIQYKDQLKWLRVRAVNARAEELIREGKRCGLLKLILKNLYLSIKLLFPLLYMFTSEKQYNKIKKIIRKSSYHV